MSSQYNESAAGSFGVEGEQGEVVIPEDGSDTQAVVKRERVCEVNDSYTRTTLCITSGDLKIELPLQDADAIQLGELLTEAGNED